MGSIPPPSPSALGLHRKQTQAGPGAAAAPECFALRRRCTRTALRFVHQLRRPHRRRCSIRTGWHCATRWMRWTGITRAKSQRRRKCARRHRAVRRIAHCARRTPARARDRSDGGWPQLPAGPVLSRRRADSRVGRCNSGSPGEGLLGVGRGDAFGGPRSRRRSLPVSAGLPPSGKTDEPTRVALNRTPA
jgi:hypothetical protein